MSLTTAQISKLRELIIAGKSYEEISAMEEFKELTKGAFSYHSVRARRIAGQLPPKDAPVSIPMLVKYCPKCGLDIQKFNEAMFVLQEKV